MYVDRKTIVKSLMKICNKTDNKKSIQALVEFRRVAVSECLQKIPWGNLSLFEFQGFQYNFPENFTGAI